MKVCVLSGSPKGQYSITWQTVRYLEKRFPEDEFTTVHVGQRIKLLEKDLTPALEAIRWAELLLFCYPVYTFIAPYQLHRFIELLKLSGEDLSGKYAAQLTTSKHFYDVTAHAYIRENCGDLGLRYLGGLSADMEDLTKPQGQQDAAAFWRLIKFRMERGLYEAPKPAETKPLPPYQRSAAPAEKQSVKGKKVFLVVNTADPYGAQDDIDAPDPTGLVDMVLDFQARWPYEVETRDIAEFPFAGGCLGCFGCAADGKCVYKDGFDAFLRDEVQTADAIVYAFAIRDHSMGAQMKLFDDRQFCNGHRTVTAGKPVGYLVRGDLDAEPNLRMILEGRANVGGNFLAGVATDEKGVGKLVQSLDYALEQHLTQPANFLGVGGMKIFRDLIWLMRGLMKADHKFYKAHGLYRDLPQYHRGTRLKMQLVGGLMTDPKLRAKLGNKLNEGMIAPYQKVLDNMK